MSDSPFDPIDPPTFQPGPPPPAPKVRKSAKPRGRKPRGKEKMRPIPNERKVKAPPIAPDVYSFMLTIAGMSNTEVAALLAVTKALHPLSEQSRARVLGALGQK